MHRHLAATLLLLCACASAPPRPAQGAPPAPPAPDLAVAPASPPPLPGSPGDRLDEAARLLGDGQDLPRAAQLLAAVAPGTPGRDLLLGQLAELGGDDDGAVAAYDRALASGDDDELRLRRALVLERLGRGAEVGEDLRRLRTPADPRAEAPAPRPARRLRPLRPSSR